MKRRSGLVLAVSDAVTADAFLKGHARYALNKGVPVILIAAPSTSLSEFAAETGAQAVALALPRAISPLRDLIAIIRATAILWRLRPEATHVGTPKAGLVIGAAGLLTRVPTRVYTLHGLRFEGAVNWRRRLLRWVEAVSCSMATVVVAVSPSVAQVARDEGVVRRGKVKVLGHGSIAGVNGGALEVTAHQAEEWAAAHGIDPGPVAIFIGRLVRDKGLPELLAAWPAIRARVPSARLIIVGDHDPGDRKPVYTIGRMQSEAAITLVGHQRHVGLALFNARVLVLPSRREGMPTVVLEAAALGIPAVGFDVTGVRDAIVDGVTGVLVPFGDSIAFGREVADLLENELQAAEMGRAARSRVRAEFNPERVVADYFALLFPDRVANE